MSFHNAKEFFDDVLRVFEKGWQPGLSTGWPNLDQFYTVREGEFTVVTGMPFHGKSEFMSSLMMNLAKLHGWKFAMVSPEHVPISLFTCRLIEKHSGKIFDQGKSKQSLTKDQLTASFDWICKHFCFYQLEMDDPPHMRKVFGHIDDWQGQHGAVQGLLLDPYNEFDHSRVATNARLSETEYVSEFLSYLRRAARIRKIHVWLVAHPTKQQPNEDGFYGPVKLYSISGSANFKNKADHGISVYRNDIEGGGDYTSIIVEKVKFRELGKQGVAYMKFNALDGSYSEYKMKGK